MVERARLFRLRALTLRTDPKRPIERVARSPDGLARLILRVLSLDNVDRLAVLKRAPPLRRDLLLGISTNGS